MVAIEQRHCRIPGVDKHVLFRSRNHGADQVAFGSENGLLSREARILCLFHTTFIICAGRGPYSS